LGFFARVFGFVGCGFFLGVFLGPLETLFGLGRGFVIVESLSGVGIVTVTTGILGFFGFLAPMVLQIVYYQK